jgi:hypothetical protein
MSKFTTELNSILVSGYDLGLKDYPIFSSEYRDKLNKKIYDHYRFHEIGFETVAKFKHYLNTTMNEIMPYYNKLYETELLSVNPLLSFQRTTNTSKAANTEKNEKLKNTVNQFINNAAKIDNTTINDTDESITNKMKSTQDSTVNSNKNIKDSSKDIHSETPSGLLSMVDITDNVYATDATLKSGANDESLTSNEGISKNDDGTTTTASDTTNTSKTNSESDTVNNTINNNDNIASVNLIESNTITESGFEIPLSDLIIRYRETFLNIDLQIIKELKDLFMMIY